MATAVHNPLAGCCKVTGRHTGDLSLRPEGVFTLWDQTDDSLVRLRRHHRRAASDLAEEGRLTEARREWYQAEEIRLHQLQRFQLRMRYGAVDNHVGTDSYDCYLRHDEAPTYWLALSMDGTNARLGRRHILRWPSQQEVA